jgi:predicted ester cyclase
LIKDSVTNALATGNTVILEVTWQETHTGTLVGPKGTVPATGKQQTTRASWVLNFDGDKIKESRHYFDMLAFMQQLCLLPS